MGMHINLLEPRAVAPLKPLKCEQPVAGELFVRACWLSGLKLEAAAAYMRISHPQLSQQLHGVGHLSFLRMLNLPVSTWSVLCALVLQRKGLDVAQAIKALAVGRAAVTATTALDALEHER